MELTVKFVFDQVGGEARQKVDDHSRSRVVQYHFLLRSLQLFVIFEVRAEQVDQDVNEEQEVNQKIENKSKEALCVSEGNLIRHDSGSVYQQENQNYIPNLLKHTVGMNQLSWQLQFFILSLVHGFVHYRVHDLLHPCLLIQVILSKHSNILQYPISH